ncbi:DNA cytosine methyltransferase [Leclercia sp.]|uniref:DNA cytosine methyltransferase n=1 Tax=Leclercia sp. TaxID=1898428 RepID=UPI0028A677DA|nr:DNA cytosine methyltransferase [Leclercia sp.]
MVIWSIFDGSGIMGFPWALAGHQVYCFNSDEADHGEYVVKMKHENIHYINHWIDDDFILNVGEHPNPDILFSFPSCTELAGSGEQHARTKAQIKSAVAMAKIAQDVGEIMGCPWMVENPVGKLSTEWRKPDHYFNPFEYGGYMSGFEPEIHPKMPARDAYTKKTCIWSGNGFVMPEKIPVHHIGKFWGWAFLGGASAKTKQLRSLTPRGFARAVYEANKP